MYLSRFVHMSLGSRSCDFNAGIMLHRCLVRRAVDYSVLGSLYDK